MPKLTGGIDDMAELLRWVRKMNAKQVGAIDAELGVTGSPDNGAVKIVEEAW